MHNVKADHIAIRTSSYAAAIDQQQREVRVHSIKYIVDNIKRTDKLLLVDDVFDTGRSIEAIIEELNKQCRLNMAEDVRVAVPYYKPSRNETGRVPDYFIHETASWLKYPHSLEGLTHQEIAAKRPRLYEIIKDFLPEQTN